MSCPAKTSGMEDMAMAGGRAPRGVNIVEKYEASEQARDRLRAILETISGSRIVTEACESLGMSTSRFQEIRDMALQGALASLEPLPRGRPAKPVEAPPPELVALREEVVQVKRELVLARAEVELAHILALSPGKRREEVQARRIARKGKMRWKSKGGVK